MYSCSMAAHWWHRSCQMLMESMGSAGDLHDVPSRACAAVLKTCLGLPGTMLRSFRPCALTQGLTWSQSLTCSFISFLMNSEGWNPQWSQYLTFPQGSSITVSFIFGFCVAGRISSRSCTLSFAWCQHLYDSPCIICSFIIRGVNFFSWKAWCSNYKKHTKTVMINDQWWYLHLQVDAKLPWKGPCSKTVSTLLCTAPTQSYSTHSVSSWHLLCLQLRLVRFFGWLRATSARHVSASAWGTSTSKQPVMHWKNKPTKLSFRLGLVMPYPACRHAAMQRYAKIFTAQHHHQPTAVRPKRLGAWSRLWTIGSVNSITWLRIERAATQTPTSSNIKL